MKTAAELHAELDAKYIPMIDRLNQHSYRLENFYLAAGLLSLWGAEKEWIEHKFRRAQCPTYSQQQDTI